MYLNSYYIIICPAIWSLSLISDLIVVLFETSFKAESLLQSGRQYLDSRRMPQDGQTMQHLVGWFFVAIRGTWDIICLADNLVRRFSLWLSRVSFLSTLMSKDSCLRTWYSVISLSLNPIYSYESYCPMLRCTALWSILFSLF